MKQLNHAEKGEISNERLGKIKTKGNKRKSKTDDKAGERWRWIFHRLNERSGKMPENKDNHRRN